MYRFDLHLHSLQLYVKLLVRISHSLVLTWCLLVCDQGQRHWGRWLMSLPCICHHWHSPFWLLPLKNNISFLRVISFHRFRPWCIFKKPFFSHYLCSSVQLSSWTARYKRNLLEHDSFLQGFTNGAYQMRIQKNWSHPNKKQV